MIRYSPRFSVSSSKLRCTCWLTFRNVQNAAVRFSSSPCPSTSPLTTAIGVGTAYLTVRSIKFPPIWVLKHPFIFSKAQITVASKILSAASPLISYHVVVKALSIAFVNVGSVTAIVAPNHLTPDRHRPGYGLSLLLHEVLPVTVALQQFQHLFSSSVQAESP